SGDSCESTAGRWRCRRWIRPRSKRRETWCSMSCTIVGVRDAVSDTASATIGQHAAPRQYIAAYRHLYPAGEHGSYIPRWVSRDPARYRGWLTPREGSRSGDDGAGVHHDAPDAGGGSGLRPTRWTWRPARGRSTAPRSVPRDRHRPPAAPPA